jgi:hypothetical protein
MTWNAKQITRVMRRNVQEKPQYPVRRAREKESKGKVIPSRKISEVNRDLDEATSV